MTNKVPHIIVNDLTMAYGSFVVQRDLTFTVNRGDIFIIMGGSGCGKSTLLRQMVGLKAPAKGEVFYEDVSFWKASPAEQERLMRNIGILYQAGALFSSMTLEENVGLPLGEYTDLSPKEIREKLMTKVKKPFKAVWKWISHPVRFGIIGICYSLAVIQLFMRQVFYFSNLLLKTSLPEPGWLAMK